jgi:hypothetical protein
MNLDHKNEPGRAHEEADVARLRRLGTVDLPAAVRGELETLVGEVPHVGEHFSPRSPRVRRRGSVILAVIGIGVVGGCLAAVPAAATINWAAQTGVFGNPDTSTEVDDTEWIDLGQGGAADVVAASYPEGIELPPGVRAADAVVAVRRLYARLADGNVQQGTIATSYETWGVCAWEREWLDAFDADDLPRAGTAGRWLSNAGNFPLTRAHDGGGILDQVLQVGQSAVDRDRSAVQSDYDRGCDRLLDGARNE